MVCQDKKAEGDKLGSQIGDLAEKNILPREIINLARKLNRLRVFGAHAKEGDLNAKDVPIMERLIKVILEYIYSTPHIIKKAEKAIHKRDGKKVKMASASQDSTQSQPSRRPPFPYRKLLVESIPEGNFKEVSIEQPKWENKFLSLIENKQHIKYDIYSMPNLSYEVKEALGKGYYRDLVCKKNTDIHYLMPPIPKQTQ
jgi:hypothetical protein